MYESMLTELAAKKDGEKETQRAQMQSLIDDLKRMLEEEKQNMGAAGKRREDELLREIANLKKELQSSSNQIDELKAKNNSLDLKIAE